MLLFIHAGFALQNKSRRFTRGSQTMENFGYVNCDFWDRRANLENDIASEKRPWNQNTLIKINDLGIILLGKEFYTQWCTQIFHSVPRFLEIIDRKCCVLSGPPCILKQKQLENGLIIFSVFHTSLTCESKIVFMSFNNDHVGNWL